MRIAILVLMLASAAIANEAVRHAIPAVTFEVRLPAPCGLSKLVVALEDVGIRRVREIHLVTEAGREIRGAADMWKLLDKPSLDELSIASVVEDPGKGTHRILVRLPFQRVTKANRYQRAILHVTILEGAVESVRVTDERGVELEKRR